MLSAVASDVAVLTVGEDAAWAAGLDPVQFGRVDRGRSGELHDCEAAGFPLRPVDRPGKSGGRYVCELPFILPDPSAL